MPSPQRVRADQETPPSLTGQGHGRRREEGSIRRGEQDPPATSAEDFELVAEHGILEIWFIETPTEEQPEQPAQEPVSDGPEHLGSLMPVGKLANQVRVADPVSLPHRVECITGFAPLRR